MVIVLLAQYASARGRGRKDYSAKAGSPINGIIYNFTWALMPAHKETIRLHPVKFAVGVLMHIGIFLAIAKALLLLVVPSLSPCCPIAFGLILGIAALCGLYLFLRRVFSVELRLMSSPDDYISILLTLVFLLMAMGHESGLMDSDGFLIYASILFFYLPLGKLKHALFFFIARADFGARLGYRGTYPAKSGVKE